MHVRSSWFLVETPHMKRVECTDAWHWCLSNESEGQFIPDTPKQWYFEKEEDAFWFKLRWA